MAGGRRFVGLPHHRHVAGDRSSGPAAVGLNTDHDVDNQHRPNGARVDRGSDEYYAGGGGTGPQGSAAFTSASPYSINGSGTLNFGNIGGNGTTSSTVTVTAISGPVTFDSMTVTNSGNQVNYTKGADTCTGNTLMTGDTCTVVVIFDHGGGNIEDRYLDNGVWWY